MKHYLQLPGIILGIMIWVLFADTENCETNI